MLVSRRSGPDPKHTCDRGRAKAPACAGRAHTGMRQQQTNCGRAPGDTALGRPFISRSVVTGSHRLRACSVPGPQSRLNSHPPPPSKRSLRIFQSAACTSFLFPSNAGGMAFHARAVLYKPHSHRRPERLGHRLAQYGAQAPPASGPSQQGASRSGGRHDPERQRPVKFKHVARQRPADAQGHATG